jgi:Fe2+ transport system protein FeoA
MNADAGNAEPPSDAEPLSGLKPGQRGKVLAVEVPGSMRGRVMEMGFTVGTVIEVVRFAPLGDPMEFKVRGAHISLRKAEAAGIRVQRV